MSLIQDRKLEHYQLCSTNKCQSNNSTHLEDIILEKSCFPHYSLSEISTKITFYEKELDFPLIIGCMTGGSKEVTKYNKILAETANEMNIAIGIGSQRSGIENKSEEILESYRIVRECAPKSFIIGNIGCYQLIQYGEILDDLISMIKGNAIEIHLNFEQELVQFEGDREKLDLHSLKNIISNWNGITIGKQVGHGMMKKDIEICQEMGMKGIDVGGIGGTSFAGVECLRAEKKQLKNQIEIGKLLWNFGVPTVMSIWEASLCSLPIISGGGIRNGLDIMKSISLGASCCSIATPFVNLSLKGTEECINYVKLLKQELESMMFLCNCNSIENIKNVNKIITGDLYHWIKQRSKQLKL